MSLGDMGSAYKKIFRSKFYWLTLLAVIVAAFALAYIPGVEMGSIKLEIYSMLGLVFGLLLLFSGFENYKQKSLIANIPTSKIRSLALGLVEISGKARPAEKVIKSPFTGEDCVFYKYEVEEYRSSGKHSRWVEIDSGQDDVPFFVEDETGKVLVDTEKADLDLPSDHEVKVRGGQEPPREIKQFIRDHEGLGSEDRDLDLKLFKLPMGNDRRYKEYFVTPGEEIYVFGKAMENRKGRMTEARADDVIISKDQTTPMFLVSDTSEKDLVSGKTRSAALNFFLGGVFFLGSLALNLWNLGLL